MLSKHVNFFKAQAVWPEGREAEMNLFVVFKAMLPAKNAGEAGAPERMLRITASSSYMAFFKGELLACGPARAGHGFFRVDELPLESDGGELKIIVAGYNINGFQYIDQTAFLCAEVTEGERVLAWTAPGTGDGGFTAREYASHIQKIQRYSFQRAFAEAYDLRRKAPDTDLKLAAVKSGEYIERGVRPADFSEVLPEAITCHGAAWVTEIAPEARIRDRVVGEPRPEFKCFPLAELEMNTCWEAQALTFTLTDPGRAEFAPETVRANSFTVLDMGREITGMPGFEYEADNELTVYLLESELLSTESPDSISFYRLGDSDVIKWILPAGKGCVMSYEPYSFRHVKLVVFGGDLRLNRFFVRQYTHQPVAKPAKALKLCEDPELGAIYDAAVETFRQNAVDIYMDCPSRERAGWLCDSYFTSRTEYALTGESLIERNFLENFLLPERFNYIPEGMLPMCYPSDHNDHVFIPSWAMWYVLELAEYLERTGDRELIDRAKERVYALIRYFDRFENEFGLLEKLESWVFVEWSHSNDLVQDVNFPNNFLYSAVLRAAGSLYNDPRLTEKGEKLLSTAAAMSFTGRFFCDNAYRRGDRLVLSGECTESCQYYAFYFGAANAESHPDLFNTMVNDFGPDRMSLGLYPEISPANAFIGTYLRLDWLMRLGRYDLVLANIRGYFLHMAQRTGTLWENLQSFASCNHGFASHVAVWLLAMEW